MRQILQEIVTTIRYFNPSERQLRLFGFVFTIILGIIAFRSESVIFFVFTALSALFTAFTPQWFLPPLKILMVLLVPVGFLISRILLVVFFYLVITPFGLIGRLFGHDPLRLKKRTLKTYWQDIEKNEHHTKMSL